MDRIYYITLLVDIYGELLTEKQKAVMTAYYFDDYSLNEIGEEQGITRQAVQDMIKRTEKILEHYESKLTLVEKHIKRKSCTKKALRLIENEIEKGNSSLKDVKKLILEIPD